jgi:hypothetical protein
VNLLYNYSILEFTPAEDLQQMLREMKSGRSARFARWLIQRELKERENPITDTPEFWEVEKTK